MQQQLACPMDEFAAELGQWGIVDARSLRSLVQCLSSDNEAEVDPYELCVFAAVYNAEQLDKQLLLRRMHLIESRLALDLQKEEERMALEQTWASVLVELSVELPSELDRLSRVMHSLHAQVAEPTGFSRNGLSALPSSLADAYAAGFPNTKCCVTAMQRSTYIQITEGCKFWYHA